MIPRDFITEWRVHAPWPSDAQVEQDLAITELALTMPHVLKEEEPAAGKTGKKGGPQRQRSGGKPPWFDGTTKDT